MEVKSIKRLPVIILIIFIVILSNKDIVYGKTQLEEKTIKKNKFHLVKTNMETSTEKEIEDKSDTNEYGEVDTKEVIDELLNTYDFDAINQAANIEVSFEEILNCFIKGQVDEAFELVKQEIYNAFFKELLGNRDIIIKIIAIAILSAIFTSFSKTMNSTYVSETGFYVTYILIFTIVIASFYTLSSIASDSVSNVIDIMKALIPAYSLSITFSTGVSTATALYELLLMAINLIQIVILKVVFSMANIYVLLVLINNISEEDRFSKLAEIIKSGGGNLLKGITAIVVGMNLIKNIIVPAIDSINMSAIQKGISAIPGGQAISAMSSIIIGSSMLIKNSIGITGTVIIILASVAPAVKILIFIISYKITTAILQPMADKRIISGIQALADGGKLIFDGLITSIIIFILTIAIVAAATNSMYL